MQQHERQHVAAVGVAPIALRATRGAIAERTEERLADRRPDAPVAGHDHARGARPDRQHRPRGRLVEADELPELGDRADADLEQRATTRRCVAVRGVRGRADARDHRSARGATPRGRQNRGAHRRGGDEVRGALAVAGQLTRTQQGPRGGAVPDHAEVEVDGVFGGIGTRRLCHRRVDPQLLVGRQVEPVGLRAWRRDSHSARVRGSGEVLASRDNHRTPRTAIPARHRAL